MLRFKCYVWSAVASLRGAWGQLPPENRGHFLQSGSHFFLNFLQFIYIYRPTVQANVYISALIILLFSLLFGKLAK